MGGFFVNIYNLLKRRVGLFFTVLSLFLVIAIYAILKMEFKEDINSIIPRDERVSVISSVFSNSQMADRIVFTISLKNQDTTDRGKLLEVGEELFASLKKDSLYIKNIDFEVDQSLFFDVYDFIYNHIPIFLDDEDYQRLDSILNGEAIYENIEAGYRRLISPTGFATGRFFFKDPINITTDALQRLNNFNIDDNFTVIDARIFTQDEKNLMLFVDPLHPSSQTKENQNLASFINAEVDKILNDNQEVDISVYGGTVVAIENSSQVKRDIIITVSLSLLFLTLLFWSYFRRLRVIALLLLPVSIGTIISLLLLSLFVGEVSTISLGIGAILLCIAIDYSIHVFTHIKESSSISEALKKIAIPLIMSSLTTASAMLCIYIIKSEALEQLALFAAFGIMFSAIAALIVLPLVSNKIKIKSENRTSKWIISIVSPEYHKNRYLVLVVIILTIVFYYFSANIKFNGDISALNYQSKKVTDAELKLKEISAEANSSVFAFTHSKSLDDALQKAEESRATVQKMVDEGIVKMVVSATDILPSVKTQKEKIEKWNKFWNAERKEILKDDIIKSAKHFKIKEQAFNQFFSLLDKDFELLSDDDLLIIEKTFLDNFIHKVDDDIFVTTVFKAENDRKTELIDQLSENPDWVIFDQQLFINKFLDLLREDFDKLSMFSMIVVFVILLLFFGRIELAVVTFLPISIGWIWTLGIMGLTGIEFNVFNIIISSIVFGLGLDYSIFIINGMIDDYKTGNTPLVHFKLSVLMSAFTTLGGFGVLVFAKHPAIKSIAFVAIVGIGSVLLITFILSPLLFNLLIKVKEKKREFPVTLSNTILSIVTFSVFLIGALIMTLLVPILWILPIRKKSKKQLISYVISKFSKAVVYMIFPIKKRIIDRDKLDLSKSKVLISNHQSHLDLVLLLMLHPKIIVFTNKWVYNNPFYGVIIRFADYFPAYRGIDEGFDKVREKVKDGYSILIFPEGKRTFDGEINRFHQGAFSVADELSIEVQPIMIHGAFDCLPKTDFFLKKGEVTLKFFDSISPEYEMTNHGKTYRKQAKAITKFYRDEYKILRNEVETTNYLKNVLSHQYIYKSPVLEWYMKIKLRLEKSYQFYDDLIPANSKVVDVGCGYGFLSYMLMLTPKNRTVIGVDYDEDKIALANNLSLKNEKIRFDVLDIIKDELPNGDVYLFNDVLHYLPFENQTDILKNCMANLPDNGLIVVRDADASQIKGTKMTKFTEYQSTKLFKFNRADHPLTYISKDEIINLASEQGFSCEIVDNSYFKTSNITYLLKKNN